MGWRFGSPFAVLLLIAVPAMGQSPVMAPPIVPPPVSGPIAPLPPVELGTPVYPSPFPPYPLPPDGYDPGPEGWSIYGPGSAPCMWLINWDLTVLKPHVKDKLLLNEGISPHGYNYSDLDSTPLAWTVAPRLEVGYRLPDTLGAFLIGYRYLGSQGTNDPAGIRTRFDLNVIDFLYQTERIRPYGNWFFHSRVGGRILTSFYDTRNVGGFATQTASNHFVGGGLVGMFDLERACDMLPGLALYTNVESSIVLGQANQKFSTSLNALPLSEQFEQRGSPAVQTIQFQFGLSYSPPTWQTLRVRTAYQYEHWFDLGQIHQSNLDMFAHGLFLRLELAY